MSNWEFLFARCILLGRKALWENPTSEAADAYVDWVLARHPDLVHPCDGYDMGGLS